MLKREITRGRGGVVILVDSITRVRSEDAGTIVVSASHGGASSAEFALEVPLKACSLMMPGWVRKTLESKRSSYWKSRNRRRLSSAHECPDKRRPRHVGQRNLISYLNETAVRLGLCPGNNLKASLTALTST